MGLEAGTGAAGAATGCCAGAGVAVGIGIVPGFAGREGCRGGLAAGGAGVEPGLCGRGALCVAGVGVGACKVVGAGASPEV